MGPDCLTVVNVACPKSHCAITAELTIIQSPLARVILVNPRQYIAGKETGSSQEPKHWENYEFQKRKLGRSGKIRGAKDKVLDGLTRLAPD